MMRRLTLLLFVLSLTTFGYAKKYPKRELRAGWIATVANIDWPSRSGLPVAQQQQELIQLLDNMQEAGLNAVVMQIRPATDAFYESSIEPWSQWLNGKQGKAPEPYYDPLQFAIEEAHKRCMEFHAWFNPYRAVFSYNRNMTTPNHITKQHPEWFVKYGKHMYFNPALKETRDYVSHVVADVVRRYEVDAVHFDDYFYPYRVPGVEFPDEENYRNDSRGFNDKEAWRRDNVDLIIQQLRDSIKSVKAYVQFGISPFGVWRNQDKDPRGSATKAGQTNYDDLYADILKWVQEGWIDYVAPQIYWHIGFNIADYKTLAEWWERNCYGKNLYIGHGLYRLDSESKNPEWHTSDQVMEQINLNRKLKNIHGSIFYSAKHIKKNQLGVKDLLRDKAYAMPALPPENKSLPLTGVEAPVNFQIVNNNGSINFKWSHNGRSEVSKPRCFVVYRVRGSVERSIKNPKNIIAITSGHNLTFEVVEKWFKSKKKYCVTAVNKLNKESAPSAIVKVKF
ncbi:glycoside hydrolase family 10 protein [Prolixibacteraceae bacterium JC049]|nr:glycoside hydrolase family 10 protein [Prolixibacteraceae bacterium JC049]